MIVTTLTRMSFDRVGLYWNLVVERSSYTPRQIYLLLIRFLSSFCSLPYLQTRYY